MIPSVEWLRYSVHPPEGARVSHAIEAFRGGVPITHGLGSPHLESLGRIPISMYRKGWLEDASFPAMQMANLSLGYFAAN